MPVTDFISLDVETANADFGSICSIGLVHFRQGQVFHQLTILVDPEDSFDSRNVAIHGITPDMVLGKPTMKQVLPIVAQQLENTIVTHHSQFDRGALRRAAARYGLGDLDCNWMDTLKVARRTWREFADNGGYGLANLARSFGIAFRHHDAAEDARAAGLIMLRALEESGLDLEDWLDLVATLPSNQARSDGRGQTRKAEIYKRYARVGAANGPLTGETIVFTGFLSMKRNDAATLAANAGCAVSDNVSRKTTILVVGDQDLRMTKGKEKSAKHIRAEGLMADGVAIRIVKESDFMLMVR